MVGDELLCFNGLNGATGEYLMSPSTIEQIAALARGESIDLRTRKDLAFRTELEMTRSFEAIAGIDTGKLEETGWGVVLPHGSDPAIREALKPLLDLRREQATKNKESYYREFSGPDGYRPGESAREFLSRCGVDASQPADPERGVPYYLLLVASPEEISFRIQYQLDVQYSVGRIWFETLAEYSRYARSVVDAETRRVRVNRKAVFFGVQNADDLATKLSATEMVAPLAAKMPEMLADRGLPKWDVSSIIGEGAKKAQLADLLGGSQTPSLLFTASHGMGFPNADPRQLPHQGALLCQDWPGPRNWSGGIPADHYFSADDLTHDANLQGLIAFHFACYGAGTPKLNDFAHQSHQPPDEIAPHAFVANLPRRMLGHENGGALAVVGHVERAWGYSFFWNQIGRQLQTFEAAMYQVMSGQPLGTAVEYFNSRYAALSTELTSELEDIRFGKDPDNRFLVGTWTAHNDARSYVILGDPAVRLPLVEDDEQEVREPAAMIVSTAATPGGRIPADSPSPESDFATHSQAEDDSATLLDQISATEQRFSKQRAQVESFDVPASSGPLQRENDPKRLRWRLTQLGLSADLIDSISRYGVSFQPIESDDGVSRTPPDDRWLERILGRNDMVDAPRFLSRGARAAQAIGRVRIQSASGSLRGWGSGSMIAPRLFLTNNHVLPTATSAKASRVEFNVQDDENGEPMPPVSFRLEPGDFFITDTALDFTMVAVAVTSDDQLSLADFGHNAGSIGDDPILVTETVNIIQHPSGRPKQVSLRDNVVSDILPDFIHYRADTEPGSSGSPVFNDQWQLVALHHSGVPQRDANGNILARDGSIWREEMGDQRIDWIANEGVRLSRILEFVRTFNLVSDTAKALRDQLFSTFVDERAPIMQNHPVPSNPSGDQHYLPARSGATVAASSSRSGTSAAAGSVTLSVPLNITVSLGAVDGTLIATSSAVIPATSQGLGIPVEEAVSIDPDYDNREGYDPEFLGTCELRVPLPELTAQQAAQAARLVNPPAGGNRHELKYHHSSVVMNAKRRLAYFTAVNIDGKKARQVTRERDKWLYDPRISRDEQVGNELYKSNPFDRGHLVRRLDPAWGRTQKIAKVANDDTFHWTNCSPQHERFNQGKNIWQGVENFLLDRAADADQKLTVFTGPVFRNDDPEYRDFQIPVEYWKVAVLVGEDGKLNVLAFLVTQEDLIRPVIGEEAAIDAARTFQTSVSEIVELTGLGFGKLEELETQAVGSFAVRTGTAAERRIAISSVEDIVLPGSARNNVAFGTESESALDGGSLIRVTGTDLSYYFLAYDANSKERTNGPREKVSDQILSALETEPITDVFLFSHGWRGDVPAAKEQYQGWLQTMAACDADRMRIRQLRPGFRPLLVGIHWPSEPWGDESLSGNVSFSAGTVAPSVDQLVDEYAQRLAETQEVRAALKVVLEAAATGQEPKSLPDDVLAAYEQLGSAVGLPANGVEGAPGTDWEGFDPEGVYEESLRDQLPQGTVSFAPISRDTLLSPLRTLSFWKMKDRGRIVGETGVHPFLVKMQEITSDRDVRFHLAGHSFGCIVASAAIAGVPGSRLLPRPVDSLALIQGAFSLWSYCNNLPGITRAPGYFHRIVSQRLVRGAIVSTQSRFDRAVGTWYPRAAWPARQVAFAAPGQLPKYGAVGTFGLQGPGVLASNVRMLPMSGDYGLRRGGIINVESSQYINTGGGFSGAHSDIRKREVGHLVWSAVSVQ